MINDVGIYRSVPDHLPTLLAHLQNQTLRIWEKHSIRQAAFCTVLGAEQPGADVRACLREPRRAREAGPRFSTIRERAGVQPLMK